MKSIAELRACSMTDNELATMFRKGDDRDKRIARCEMAGRGYQTYAGISLRDPENGNGQVAPEEVKRAQEEIKMSNQHGKPFNPSSIKLMINGEPAEAGGESITVLDGMTPEKECAIVTGIMDGLLSRRLISKMAHGVVTGVMDGYCAASDNQS